MDPTAVARFFGAMFALSLALNVTFVCLLRWADRRNDDLARRLVEQAKARKPDPDWRDDEPVILPFPVRDERKREA